MRAASAARAALWGRLEVSARIPHGILVITGETRTATAQRSRTPRTAPRPPTRAATPPLCLVKPCPA